VHASAGPCKFILCVVEPYTRVQVYKRATLGDDETAQSADNVAYEGTRRIKRVVLDNIYLCF